MYKAAALALVVLATLTSCSRQEHLTRDELKSKLRLAASIAAETNTFIDYVEQKRATSQYAKAHLEYLASELRDTTKELSDALPPADAEAQFTAAREELQALASRLDQLRRNIDQPGQLAREKDQLAALSRELQQTISSL